MGDHDHFTGKFKEAACNKCNLNLKRLRFILYKFTI